MLIFKRFRAATAPVVAALAMLGPGSGCVGRVEHPEGGSPIVRPDSEEGKKAIADSETLLKLRQQEEAKSRRRLRTSPEQG